MVVTAVIIERLWEVWDLDGTRTALGEAGFTLSVAVVVTLLLAPVTRLLAEAAPLPLHPARRRRRVLRGPAPRRAVPLLAPDPTGDLPMTLLSLALPARSRAFDGVLGMNARNDRIARENPFASVRLVNDKAATEAALRAAGAPTSPTLALLSSRRDLRALDWAALPGAWALKPNQGLGGSGILLSAGRTDDGSGWVTGSGRSFGLDEVADHVRQVLDGEFSSRGRDCALLEPLIRAHPTWTGCPTGVCPTCACCAWATSRSSPWCA